MSEQGDNLKQQFDDNVARARALSVALDDVRFTRQPEPGRWSAATCLDHLNVTNESYVRKIRRALAASEKRKGRDHVGPGLLGGLFLRMMEPPVKRRLPAPKPFTPGDTRDRVAILQRFEQVHKDLKRLIDEAAEYDWSRVKMSSPASKLIRFNLAAALAIIAAHDRRHLWQAEEAGKGTSP
jgi:hypothetical protein